MIRNVILHLNNEQPLLADLYEPPSPGDVGLRCTNLRMMNGKRPVFVDDMMSVFVFAYHRISFIEVPRTSLVGTTLEEQVPVTAKVAAAVAAGVNDAASGEDGELEIDEDFLRRIREV